MLHSVPHKDGLSSLSGPNKEFALHHLYDCLSEINQIVLNKVQHNKTSSVFPRTFEKLAVWLTRMLTNVIVSIVYFSNMFWMVQFYYCTRWTTGPLVLQSKLYITNLYVTNSQHSESTFISWLRVMKQKKFLITTRSRGSLRFVMQVFDCVVISPSKPTFHGTLFRFILISVLHSRVTPTIAPPQPSQFSVYCRCVYIAVHVIVKTSLSVFDVFGSRDKSLVLFCDTPLLQAFLDRLVFRWPSLSVMSVCLSACGQHILSKALTDFDQTWLLLLFHDLVVRVSFWSPYMPGLPYN